MDTKNPIIPEKIRFVRVEVLGCNVNIDPNTDYSIDPIGFKMGFGNKIDYNFEDGMCRVRLEFEMEGIADEGKKLNLSANFFIENHIHIENFDDNIKRTKDGIAINKSLPATLLGMAFSTARGIIFERTLGTPFRGIILPVIDPYHALDQSNIEFQKNDQS